MRPADQRPERHPKPPIAARKNPYLFLVGCPRSGTTLLQRMLDSHPDLAVANDSHFVPRAVARCGAKEDVPLTDELVDRVLRYRRFVRLGVSEAAGRAAASRARTYSEFVSELYSEHARLHGKDLAGEKTPDYVRYLPLLHALFPRARVIHIVRDGRDVALSTLEWASEEKGPGKFALWREEPVGVCALWWRWQVDSGRREGARLGSELYREVRYEDLVADPEATLRSLAGFLDLPFAPEMVSFYAGKTKSDAKLSAKSAWLPATPGLRNWRAEMLPEKVALFERLSGDLLSELKYERAFDEFPPETVEAARECRAWWDAELAARQERLERRLAGVAT
ncbi:MAG TPA: sulfotransferase [Thermoanaerobaculia bacterium]|nr:sulfotransferase [Thermoanaerobaculia bacterium]